MAYVIVFRLKNRKNKRRKQGKKTAIDGKTTGRAKRDEISGGRKQKKKKKDNKFRCLWIKVPYPVTEDCTCSCRKFDE